MVTARGLSKRYGKTVALAGLDLDVPAGSVLGLLGPNGAGKTTTVSILTTLITPDTGTATVAGADLITEPRKVRERIGLSGQYAAVDEHLTATENLEMIGQLYRLKRSEARRRAVELVEMFRLTDAADRPIKTFSGGMRRRIDLACSLIADPPVLFLDEPTTGLDPRSRTELWQIIRERVAAGTTVLLTTQYLEEADQLADEIIVIDHGLAIAQGTSDELKRLVGGEHLDITLRDIDQVTLAASVIEKVATGPLRVVAGRGEITAPVVGGADALSQVLRALHDIKVEIVDIGVRRPTLDDVFMELTGRSTEETSGSGEES
jgi:ABC-2 type transport system ATP-binding protein